MTDKELAMREIDSLILSVESRIQNFDYDVRMASTKDKLVLNRIILSALKHCSANLCYAKEQIHKFESESGQ